MRTCLIFIALGCSGPTPAPPVRPPAPVAIDAAIVIDAAPPIASARGGVCSAEIACADPLACLPSPGGYCASPCGSGVACDDGACVPTPRTGAVCMQRCALDGDCRTAEGYVCDAQWKACMIPNAAVIAPAACPAGTRDTRFGAATRLSTSAMPGIAQRAPVAAVTPSGELFVAFASEGATASWLGGATVGVPPKPKKGEPPPAPRVALDRVITTADGRRGEPSLARDAKGILYVAWLDESGEDREPKVLLARSRDGGATWTGPDRADDPTDCLGRAGCLGPPQVLVGPNPEARGSEVVYILHGAAGGLRVRASRDEGATFRAAASALSGSVASAHVAADGALHVVGLEGDATVGGFGSANRRVVYTVSTDVGRTFAKPQRLDRRDEMLPVYFARPQIVADTRRRVLYALYVRGGRDARWDFVLLASRDAGTTWKRTRLGDDCAMQMLPQLALDPATGTLHVAWLDSRGGGRLARASCTSGARTCTQHGAISDAPFVLTAERHAPATLGDRATLLVDDKRRTLHAVWAQPVDDGGMTVTRILHAIAKLRP